MKSNIKSGPKLLSSYSAEIEKHIKDTYSNLSEKDRRRYAAIEAQKLGYGGISYISLLFVCDEKTMALRAFAWNR